LAIGFLSFFSTIRLDDFTIPQNNDKISISIARQDAGLASGRTGPGVTVTGA
jgi:hypothetical protein